MTATFVDKAEKCGMSEEGGWLGKGEGEMMNPCMLGKDERKG
jgi:hypothetical protein